MNLSQVDNDRNSTAPCADGSACGASDSRQESRLTKAESVAHGSAFLRWITVALALHLVITVQPLFAEPNGPSIHDTDESHESVPEVVNDEGKPATDTADRQSSFSRRDVLIASLTIFVLAVFVGFEVIAKVPPTLHTPLMSGSNAISGITIVGALIAASSLQGGFAALLGLFAVVLATINVVGGFMVTGRMLAMFQKKKA